MTLKRKDLLTIRDLDPGEIQIILDTANAVIAENPYVAVTGEGGKFEIKDVPAGSYTLEIWHEKLGTKSQKVEVKAGDTLGKIASVHHTTVELIKKANGLKSDVIHPRQALKVPKGPFRIVVDKSQNELLLTANNQFFKLYPVATGTDNSTPVGTFKVVNKVPNPVWYRQGAVVPPDSPENILGTRWLGLDRQGYGIHGSVDPTAIGQHVTAGCVRMTNADVEELFAIVPTGTEVAIVD